MASKGQKFASYSLEFKNEVLEAYKSGKYGGRDQVAKHYNISSATIVNVNLFCRFLVKIFVGFW